MTHALSRYLTCSLLCCILFNVPNIAQATPRAATRYLKQLHRQAARQKSTPENLQAASRYLLEGTIGLLTHKPLAAWKSLQQALKCSPLNATTHYRLAQLLAQYPQVASKSRQRAETHIHAAMALAPHNKYYYTTATHMYLQQEQYAEAIQVYEQMLQHLPSDENVLLYLAELYTDQQDHRQALRLYNQVEQQQGILPSIVRQKQYSYLQMGRLDEAVAEGIKLVQAYPDTSSYTIDLANLLRDHDQIDQAIGQLQTFLDVCATDRPVRLYLARLLLKQGSYVEALTHIRQLVADVQLPLEDKLALMSAYLQCEHADISAELQHVTKAFCKTHPQDVRVLTLCGDLCKRHGEITQALQHYHQALASSVPRYALWQRIVDIYATQQMSQYLLRATHEALAQFPTQAMLYYYQGIAYLMQRQYANAATTLAQGKVFATTSEEQERLNSELGNVYGILFQYDKADACYQAVLEINPDNYEVLNNYSYGLALRKQQLMLAKKMSHRLVKAHPTCAHYLDTYAWVLYQCGEYKQAKQYLEEALLLAPTTHRGAILEHYGDTLYQLGELQAALAQWREAQKESGVSTMLIQKLEMKQLVP